MELKLQEEVLEVYKVLMPKRCLVEEGDYNMIMDLLREKNRKPEGLGEDIMKAIKGKGKDGEMPAHVKEIMEKEMKEEEGLEKSKPVSKDMSREAKKQAIISILIKRGKA
jgi:preprotein translocase subunit SecF